MYPSNELIITRKEVKIENHLQKIGNQDLIPEIIEGLMAEQKCISSKFFYDEFGSELFEQITQLPEYYPARTEKAVLHEVAPTIAKELKNIDIIELGSGDCSKISILFNQIRHKNHETVRYIPLDVSASAIEKAADELAVVFPEIKIKGLVADFMSQINVVSAKRNRLFCFFGSTLGNLTQTQALQFLVNLSDAMLPGDQLILGLDMVKPVAVLEAAYNDARQLTANFNKNILKVVNTMIGSNFDARDFLHKAFFNRELNRIEMHLEATKQMEIISPKISPPLSFEKGETIHTENSHKFTRKDINHFAVSAGFDIKNIFNDQKKWFSLVHFKK
jgi:L-histidine Nalpha-methyltransferase